MQTELCLLPQLTHDPRVFVFRRIFSLPGEFERLQVDAYAILTQRYLVLCDTLFCPTDTAMMLTTLHDHLQGRQLLVINSHADWDHCWGNSYFSDPCIPIIAHAHSRVRLQSAQTHQLLTHYQQCSPLFHDVHITLPNHTFEHSMTILGGDLTLHLLHTPGHTQDHLALWLPEISLLLAFDAVEYPFPTLEATHSVQAMFHTLRTLQNLQPAMVLCSHGETTETPLIERNLAYFEEIQRRIRLGIPYPYTEIVDMQTEHIDHSFYREVHEQNIAYIQDDASSLSSGN